MSRPVSEWERLLGIRWPDDACDQSGECCRGAAQVAPWQNALLKASQGDDTLRDFFSIFIPYENLQTAKASAPYAVESSLTIAEERGDNLNEVVFYHCGYLKGKNQCQIYEDRPQLCRDYPESPFGALPKCCGYQKVAQQCHEKIRQLKTELSELQKQQADR